MNDALAKQTGSALLWKAIQLAGVKGIFLIRTLILARLLAPDDFGLLAIATVTIGFLMTVTDVGMLQALVQRPEAADQHYDTAWTVGMIRAVAVTGAVILAAPIIALLFAEPRATNIIRLLAFRPLLEAAASIKVAELTRNLRFQSLTFTTMPAAIIDTSVAIALAQLVGVWALVAGALAGAAAGTTISYLVAPHRPRLAWDGAAAQALIRYGRWIFIGGLVTVAGNFMLQLVISRRLGSSDLGLYFLSGKLAFLPYEVASQVVGAVAFPLYARLQGDAQQAARAFRAIVMGMASILFPIYALTIVLAPSLVEHVLGPRWAGTVPVIQVLSVVCIVGFFGDATGPLLKGLGQPYKLVIIEVIQTSLIMLLVWSLAGRYGLTGAAAAWLPAVAMSQIFSAVFVKQLLPRPFAGLRQPMTAIAVAAGIGAAVALSVDRILSGVGGFVAAALLAVTATGGLLWALDRYFHLGIADNLPRAFPQVARLAGR